MAYSSSAPTMRSSIESFKTPFLPVEEEDAGHGQPEQKRVQQSDEKQSRFLKLIILILAFLLLLRTFVDWAKAGTHCDCGSSTTSTHSVSSDKPEGKSRNPLPEFRKHTQEFYNSSSQYGIANIPWSEEEWMTWYNNWDAFFPPGRGMVKIQHPEEYPNLPPPMKDPPKNGGYKYELAITHQLHCLWTLQRYFYEVQAGLRPGDHWTTLFHINHCTDYLRWTLLCHADTTIEGWDEEQLNNPTMGGKHQFETGPTGFHATHQCTDYSHVYEWMEENRWDDLKSMDHGIEENATYADWNNTWRNLDAYIKHGS